MSTSMYCEANQTHLSPARFAAVIEMSELELADALKVHPNVMRLMPEKELVQSRLANFVAVFERLLEVNSDVKTAAFHMKNTPIRTLNHRTLLEAVRDNEVIKAMRYLQSISYGQSG